MLGRLGGPTEPLLTDLDIAGGARVGGGGPSDWASGLGAGAWPTKSEDARIVGGPLGTEVGPDEVGGPLAVRGGPAARGGGGVAVGVGAVSPPFLLIHRFSSGS